MDILAHETDTVEWTYPHEERWTVSDQDELERLEFEYRQNSTFEAFLLTQDDDTFVRAMRAIETLREIVRRYRGTASLDWLLARIV